MNSGGKLARSLSPSSRGRWGGDTWRCSSWGSGHPGRQRLADTIIIVFIIRMRPAVDVTVTRGHYLGHLPSHHIQKSVTATTYTMLTLRCPLCTLIITVSWGQTTHSLGDAAASADFLLGMSCCEATQEQDLPSSM